VMESFRKWLKTGRLCRRDENGMWGLTREESSEWNACQQADSVFQNEDDSWDGLRS
jgi:hypothetical protein